MQSIARDLAQTKGEYLLIIALAATVSENTLYNNTGQFEEIAQRTLDEYRSLPVSYQDQIK